MGSWIHACLGPPGLRGPRKTPGPMLPRAFPATCMRWASVQRYLLPRDPLHRVSPESLATGRADLHVNVYCDFAIVIANTPYSIIASHRSSCALASHMTTTLTGQNLLTNKQSPRVPTTAGVPSSTLTASSSIVASSQSAKRVRKGLAPTDHPSVAAHSIDLFRTLEHTPIFEIAGPSTLACLLGSRDGGSMLRHH